MVEEIWKPIKGYEGLYEVSTCGNVRGLKRGKILSPKVNNKTGYVEVNLCKPTEPPKTVRVHRVVAFAFIPCDNPSLEVNHRDENKLNNHVSNLEWCDRHYNTHYGRRKTLSWDDVNQIRLLKREGYSVNDLSKRFNVSSSQIYKILKHYQWR